MLEALAPVRRLGSGKPSSKRPSGGHNLSSFHQLRPLAWYHALPLFPRLTPMLRPLLALRLPSVMAALAWSIAVPARAPAAQQTPDRSDKSAARMAATWTKRPRVQPSRGTKALARGNMDRSPARAKSGPAERDASRHRPAPGSRELAPPTLAPASPKTPRSNPYLEVPGDAVAVGSPAYTYANWTDEAALAELERRQVSFAQETEPVPGVRTPIRLQGPLRGVTIHGSIPEPQRAVTPYEILDARLALALDDLCVLLAEHGVVELVHLTMYRPAAGWKRVSTPPSFRHPGGLAIDVAALRQNDGAWLNVAQHWLGAVGKKTCCTAASAVRPSPGGELRNIVCEAARRRIFHYMLTPDFDAAHRDHLHLEIKPGVRWFLTN